MIALIALAFAVFELHAGRVDVAQVCALIALTFAVLRLKPGSWRQAYDAARREEQQRIEL